MAARSVLQYLAIMAFAVLVAVLYMLVASAALLPALMLGVGIIMVGALLNRGRVITWSATLMLVVTFVVLLLLVLLGY